jgi:anthranilate synthase/phosphoribosyltransferase
MLGVRRVMTVHSDDGMDEISPFCPTRVAEMGEDGELKEYSFDPRSAGVEPDPHGDLAGGSASRNVEMARRLLAEPGAHPALRDAVALNAGAGLYVCGLAESLESGYRAAMAALADGRVAKKLEEVVSLSKVLS